MRTACPVEAPPARPAGSVEPWLEIVAWLVGFALLLAAPCAPEPPLAGGARDDARSAISAPRADAPPRR